MKRQKFRIICYSKGDRYYFDTKVHTWFGWVSFSVFYKTEIIHVFTDPSFHKKLAYERISQYCLIKGYDMKHVEIREIDKNINKKWILFQRVYSE